MREIWCIINLKKGGGDMSYFHGVERTKELDRIFVGKKTALITNPTGVDRNFYHTADLFAEKFRLCALFAPEHGIRGEIQAGGRVDSFVDERTGIPVYSAYSDAIDDAMLSDVDIIAYDIQAVGSRFYTYIYTLSALMERGAALGKKVIVLDRYNPIGLEKIQGTLLDERFSSGVGKYELPTRYAMTVGEFAQYINIEKGINCDLEILPCEGLSRKDDYRSLNVLWTPPSPNLPTYESALAYVGTVLLEGTNMSEGRGTTKPFEYIGAPWLRADEVIKYIDSLGLSGFALRECYFTPTFSKYAGELCHGIQIYITDPDSFDPFSLGLFALDYIRKTHDGLKMRDPQSEKAFINLLLGTDAFMKDNFDAYKFIEDHKKKLVNFRNKTEKYLIYPDLTLAYGKYESSSLSNDSLSSILPTLPRIF